MYQELEELLRAHECADREKLKYYVSKMGKVAAVRIDGCEQVILARTTGTSVVRDRHVKWDAFREALPQDAFDAVPELGDQLDRYFGQFV